MWDSDHRPVRIGRLIKSGGEGVVYETDRPGVAAKIYHDATSSRVEKLSALLALRTDSLESFTAWPLSTLHGRSNVLGFLMPYLTGHLDIHKVYSPKSRRASIPNAGYRFLARVATNTAKAVATVHDAGCVIGDINHGGVFVARDATVKLLDCDSFQVQLDGRTFFCTVSVPAFTPPEVQGQDLSTFVRTESQDSFGLALLLFHLLMMGRHPFAGRYTGTGDMSIERAISERRYAFGADRLLHAPIGMSADMIPPPLRSLFRQAFTTLTRPTAAEWVASLEEAESLLQPCENNSAHAKFNDTCPWCGYESATGVTLFGGASTALRAVSYNLSDLIARVNQVPHPQFHESRKIACSEPSYNAHQDVLKFERQTSEFRLVAIGSAFLSVVFVIALLFFGIFPLFGVPLVLIMMLVMVAVNQYLELTKSKASIKKTYTAKRDHARNRLKLNNNALVSSMRAGRDKFMSYRQKIFQMVSSYKDLPSQIKSASQSTYDTQLKEYLAQFHIMSNDIPNVSLQTKAAMLAAGIVTAADVSKSAVLKVRNCNQATADRMVAWRNTVRKAFVPRAPTAAELQRQLVEKQAEYHSFFASAPSVLREIGRRAEDTYMHRLIEYTAAQMDSSQREKDYEYIASKIR